MNNATERDITDIALSLASIADSFHMGDSLSNVAESLVEISFTLTSIDTHLVEMLERGA